MDENKKPEPPAGYRLLKNGELKEVGDLSWHPTRKKWDKVLAKESELRAFSAPNRERFYCRKID
jgi:hypothetical protein